MDTLIEEQVRLKEQEMTLMKKVKMAQKKADSKSGENFKRTQPVTRGGSLAKARSGSAKAHASSDNAMGASGLSLHQESKLRIMKEQLFNSNR